MQEQVKNYKSYSLPMNNQEAVIQNLLTTQGPYCVSMCMPCEVAGIETRQNPIRFKNLIREVHEQLKKCGMVVESREQYLSTLSALQEDYEFWQHQAKGLVIFLTEDQASVFHLPDTVEEFVVVSNHFHVTQLLAQLCLTQSFYLLVLRQHQPTLFKVNGVELQPIALPKEVQSVDEVLGEKEKHVQFHSGNPSNASPVYHGQGTNGDQSKKKEDIHKYFRELSAAVQTKISSTNAPLMLSGVAYLHAIYRKVNNYPYLMQASIESAPGSWGDHVLHQQAWSLFQEETAQQQQQTVEHFYNQIETDKTSVSLEEVIPASHYGRIAKLLLAKDKHAWGTFEPKENKVKLIGENNPMREDLLNLAAQQTLLHGGEVYPMSSEELPQGTSCAAIFRY